MVAVGNNTYGQLNVLDWSGITAVSTKWFHTVGLKEDGTAVGTGWNGYGQLNVSDWSGIRQPACIDKTPPVLNLSVSPNILWPPDHKMVDVTISGEASDSGSGIASVVFTVTDEYGKVQPTISGFNTSIALEAWRNGTDMDGRHYTITVTATDAAGNKTTATTTVLVPHDQGD